MGRRLTPPEPVLVERQDQITEFVAQCRAEGAFAFDTEFVMEDRYEPEVCLIQIANNSGVYLIDPFGPFDLQPVWDMVCDERVETIVHAGQEDLGLCYQHTGNLPRRVFDVQVASGLVGLDYPLSLQKLAQSTIHVRLHKSKTLTDWRRRPLSASQIRYAAEDVAYLSPIRRRLGDKLRKTDRTSWANEEFRLFEEVVFYRRAEEEKLWHIKGAGSLEGAQLSVLHDLLAWRDELAKSLNRPVRVVLKDYLLVEIAKQSIANYAELRDLRGLNLSDKHVHSLVKTVRAALEKPEDQWPKSKPREIEAPGETVLVDLITAVIRGYCLEHELAYSLVATKRSIRELVRHHLLNGQKADNQIELLSGWRGETIGGLLCRVLDGKGAVRIGRRGDEWTVSVDP